MIEVSDNEESYYFLLDRKARPKAHMHILIIVTRLSAVSLIFLVVYQPLANKTEKLCLNDTIHLGMNEFGRFNEMKCF